MFAAYQIKDVAFENPDNLIRIGRSSEEKTRAEVAHSLDQYLSPEGTVDAESMMVDWFPDIDANVFISHSHADERLALALSGWLKREFGLLPFIDSCVWQHAHNLIKLLDDSYCKTGPNLYSYEASLVTASHVHLMLSTSITKMMDRCECIFFLNTSNSISPTTPREMVGGTNSSTHSPWLFHEIAMMNLRKRRKHRLLPDLVR